VVAGEIDHTKCGQSEFVMKHCWLGRDRPY